jgi:heme-degrading monooxygenase HmoA
MMELKDIDPSFSFFEQLEAAGDGPVTVINTFVAPEGGVEASLEAWATESAQMKARPGFISAQLYVGVGDSRVLTNVAVWESAEALKDAFSQQDFADTMLLPPDGAVAYPVLMRKAAMPGVCVA